MGSRRVLVLLVFLAVAGSAGRGADLSIGMLAGYKGGLTFRAGALVNDFARGFPLATEVAAGVTFLDPGKPEDARRIFINDATNGVPEKRGHQWDFRLDFLYPVRLAGIQRAYIYAGPRLSAFTGNFNYVGGNEDFDVTSTQWGWGAGVRAHFPMSLRVDFVLSAGFDHFLGAALYGHDTSYSPNGETVNGQHEYTYSDADAAVGQPKFQVTALLGFSYRL